MQFECVRNSYKSLFNGDGFEVSKFTDNVVPKEIYDCYSTSHGTLSTFLNRISVLARKRIWLNDENIDRILNFEKIEHLENVINKITAVRSAIIDVWTNEPSVQYLNHRISSPHVKLIKYQHRLACLNEIISNKIKQKASSLETEPSESQKLPDSDLDAERNSFEAGLEAAKNATENWRNANKVAVLDKCQTIMDIVVKDTITKRGQALPLIIKDVFVRVLGVKTIVNIGVANVVAFIQKKIVAESAGDQFLNELNEENWKVLDRYAELERKIVAIEGMEKDPSHFSNVKIYLTDMMQKEGEHLLELKEERAALQPKMDQLKELYHCKKAGSAIPMVGDALIGAVDRHFCGVAQAVISLRSKYGEFDSLPTPIKEYLILRKLNELQKDGKLEKVNAIIISAPMLTEEELRTLEDLLSLAEQGRGRDQKMIDALEAMAEKLAKMMTLECATQIDRQVQAFGKLALKEIIFPNGIPLNLFSWAITKLFRIDMKQIEDKIATTLIKKTLESMSDPNKLNKKLERKVDARLQRIHTAREIKNQISILSKDLSTYNAVFDADKFKETEEMIEELRAQLQLLEGKLDHSSKTYNKILSGSQYDTKEEPDLFKAKCKDLVFNLLKISSPDKKKMLDSVEYMIEYRESLTKWIDQIVKGVVKRNAVSFDNSKVARLMKRKIESLTTPRTRRSDEHKERRLCLEQKLLSLAEAETEKIKAKSLLLSMLPLNSAQISNPVKYLFEFVQMPVLNRILAAELFSEGIKAV